MSETNPPGREDWIHLLAFILVLTVLAGIYSVGWFANGGHIVSTDKPWAWYVYPIAHAAVFGGGLVLCALAALLVGIACAVFCATVGISYEIAKAVTKRHLP